MLTSISEKRDSGYRSLSDRPRYGKRAYPVPTVARKAYGIGYSVTALQGVRCGVRCRKTERAVAPTRFN